MSKFIRKNLVVFTLLGTVIGLIMFPVWSHLDQEQDIVSTNSRVDTVYDELKTLKLNGNDLLVGASGFFAQNASVQLNLEVMGSYASTSGNLSFNGEIMPDGATCSNGQILKRTGANDWDCAADADSGAAGAADSDVPFVTIGNTASLSFERALTGTANQITVTDGGANGNVTLSIPSLLVGTGASFSYGEFTISASASAFIGTAFSSVGDCNDATEAIGWTTTGIFNCRSVQDLDATLTALAAFNTNGLLTQTAADTFTGRTITGTTNQITVSNGDGVAGNPTLSIPSLLVGTGASFSYGEFTVQASASIYLGTAFVSVGDCNDGGEALRWTTTGIFSCGIFTAGTNLTLTGDDFSVDDAFILNTGDTGTGVYDFGGADSFEGPNGTGGTTVNAAGEFTFDTASESFNYYSGTREVLLGPFDKCPAYSLDGTDLSANSIFSIWSADEPYTIGLVTMKASGSLSATWNLVYGLTAPTTTVFSANKQASGSALVRYTSFTNSAIPDGATLYGRVTSKSATLDDVLIRVCMWKTP